MADFRVITGFLTEDLVGANNMSAGPSFTGSGSQASGADPISLIFSDTTDDDIIQGNRLAGETQGDVNDDQFGFIHDALGNVIIDGSPVYLELTF